MLTVEHYELIRRKFFIDGISAPVIAQELDHSRKTIAKALEHAAPPMWALHSGRLQYFCRPRR